jgi:hypothetical protein
MDFVNDPFLSINNHITELKKINKRNKSNEKDKEGKHFTCLIIKKSNNFVF